MKSDMFIARQTGIPRSTLGFVRRGERKLPSIYTNQIRATYQRTIYEEMKSFGYSATQARRFSWYAPETVRVQLIDYRLRVQEMALGVMTNRIKTFENEGIAYDEVSEYERAFVDVEEGLRRSKASYEDIVHKDY